MNPLEEFGIATLPDEQIVLSRTGYLAIDGEVAGISTHRFIAVGTAWPGPSLFGYTVPLEKCRMIEYRTNNYLRRVVLGWLIYLFWIAALVGMFLHFSIEFFWFVPLAFMFMLLVGLGRLFRLQSTEICFHSDEETPLKWSFRSNKRSDNEQITSKIRTFAEGRGIEISNFPGN